MHLFINRTSAIRQNVNDAIARLRNINDNLSGPIPEDPPKSCLAAMPSALLPQLSTELQDASESTERLHAEIDRLSRVLDLENAKLSSGPATKERY
jgi:hypothetical protein